jgi:hypothetical protein
MMLLLLLLLLSSSGDYTPGGFPTVSDFTIRIPSHVRTYTH